jgi:uroporphyrinogen-III synthase
LRAKIAVVGPTTARAIEGGGGVVALLPEDNRQEGLVKAFRSVAAGTRVLFPIAEGGRTLLAESLRSRGCVVDVVTAYRTLPKFDLAPAPAFDVATFASPSALRAYLAHAGRESLAGKMVAVIGPSTAKEAAANGILPAVARTPNVDALILAIARSRTSQGDP